MKAIGVGVGIPFGRSRGWTTQSVAYFAAQPTVMPTSYKIEADRRIKILVDSGVWDKIDILYFWDMDSEANSLVNVKGVSAFNAEVVGDMIHIPKVGFYGSGGYINTNWNPSTAVNFEQNSASFGWCKTSIGFMDGHNAGAFDGTRAIQAIGPSNNVGGFLREIYLNAITSFTPVGLDKTGLNRWNHIVRTASNKIKYYNNNTIEESVTNNSNGLPNQPLFVFSTNDRGNQGTLPLISDQSIFYTAGGLSTDEVMILNTINTWATLNEDQYIQVEVLSLHRVIWRNDDYWIAVDATTIYLSKDGGGTYPYSIAVTAANKIQFAIRYSNGIIIFATYDNKLWRSTDDFSSIVEFSAKDTSGSDYTPHVPASATYPGSYFFPPDYIYIRNISEKEVAVWSNYTNVNTGASPTVVWSCIDGGDVVASYVFGQNPAYRDNGTHSGGTTGTLLGDAGNAVITRHGHGVGFDPETNIFYITTGDHTNECHWYSAEYNPTTEVLTFLKLHTSNGSTRFKSSNPLIEGDFVYFGTDAGPDVGLWKVPKSDIFNTATHQRLGTLTGYYAAIRKEGDMFAGIYITQTGAWGLVVSTDMINFTYSLIGHYPYRVGQLKNGKFDLIDFTGLHSGNVRRSYLVTIK